MKKAKKGDQPRCRKCGNPARYYGPVGGYSVQCESCNRHQSTLRRAAAARRREAKPKKKPRRVVLGVGHPWFYFSPGCIGLTKTPVSDSPLLRSFDWKEIDTGGLSNHNKVRLVLEVLK